MHFFLLIFVLLNCGFSSAQHPVSNDSCLDLCKPAGLNMTIDKVEGIWFLQLSIPVSWQRNSKCISMTYREIDSTSLFAEIAERNKTTKKERKSNAYVAFDFEGSMNFTYSEFGLPFSFQVVSLEPDYMAIISCNDCGFYSKDSSGFLVYIYTRLQFPSCENLEKAISTVTACGIPRNFLIYQDQKNCTMS